MNYPGAAKAKKRPPDDDALPKSKRPLTDQERHEAARAFALGLQTQKVCAQCQVSKCEGKFSKRQLIRLQDRICKACVRVNVQERAKQKRQKIARLMAAPRKCSDCGQVKDLSKGQNEEEVSRFQQRCLSCYPDEEADLVLMAMAKQQNYWDMEWNRMKYFWAGHRKQKLEFYDFPLNHSFSGFPGQWDLGKPDPNALPGKYQLIYHFGESFMEYESRTVHNSFLTLEMEGDGKWKGTTSFDKNSLQRRESRAFCSDFCLLEGHPSNDKIHFSTAKFLDKAQQEEWAECPVATAKISAIQDRVALPWMPQEVHEKSVSFGDGTEREWADPNKMIEFESLEEADKLVEVYEKGHGSSDWLCQHKGLPPDIAKRIHDFVSCKPRPVLFLEPGDLILNVQWHDSTADGSCYSYFVARKVKK